MLLNDSYLSGLSQYKVKNVDIRPLRMSARITLLFEKLEMEGWHETKATALQGIFPITLSGSGPYNMTFENLEFSIYADFTINNGSYLNVKNLIVAATIGTTTTNFTGFGVLTGVFNNLASVALPPMLVLQQIKLNLRIYEELIPSLNFLLNNITILDLAIFIVELLKSRAINTIIGIIQGFVCNLK